VKRGSLYDHGGFLVALSALGFCHRHSQGPRLSDAGLIANSEWNLFASRRRFGLAADGRLGPRFQELDALRHDLGRACRSCTEYQELVVAGTAYIKRIREDCGAQAGDI
jgi:hypothetical protein